MERAFTSKFKLRVRTEFSAIGFAEPRLDPAVLSLRREMNEILHETAASLPKRFASEARALLDEYHHDFLSLFYSPVWSFLHWLPAASPHAVDPAILRAAKAAQALSLLLHMWDDHLCDGDLPVNLVTLQFRTVAWQRFLAECRELCRRLDVRMDVVEAHTTAYLTSLHFTRATGNFETYCRRFVRQIGIWTLIPHQFGRLVAGPGAGLALRRIVEDFGICWRVLDDLQDAYEDVRDGALTAVVCGLDREGVRRWDLCNRSRSDEGELDAKAWRRLADAIRQPDCLVRLLTRVDRLMRRSIRLAESRHWPGLALELAQLRQGLDARKSIRTRFPARRRGATTSSAGRR